MPWATTSQTDDTGLVRQLQAGDEAAFTTLYERHRQRVLAAAQRVTMDRRMAEDVTQEVFTYLWLNAHRVDPERGELRAFLATLARQRSIDRIRSEISRRQRQERVGGPGVPVDEPTEDVASEVVEADDNEHQQAVLHDAITRLPNAMRTSVQLAYFQGHTYRQVADAMGVPEGTAKSRLRLAIERLRGELGPARSSSGEDLVSAGRPAS